MRYMRIKSSRLRGTITVFSFTLRQLFKNRANTVSLIILFLFSLLSVPVMSLSSGQQLTHRGKFDKIYIDNRTSALFTSEDLLKSLSADEIIFESGHSANGNEVVVTIEESEPSIFSADISYSKEHSFPVSDLDTLRFEIQSVLQKASFKAQGISEEQFSLLTAGYDIYSDEFKSFSQSASDADISGDMTLQMIYSILIMMLSIFSVSYIIRAVVDEKASKLIELLMISINPLALICGKILAAMVYILALFAIIIAGFLISYCVGGMFFDTAFIKATVDSVLSSFNVDAVTLAVTVISCLFGYLTFAFIAGISGASCNNMEETGSASFGSMIIIFLCYMVSLVIPALSGGAASVICSLIPFLSVFCMPPQFMSGNIGLSVVIPSLLIQAAVIVLLCLLCAKVYRDLILYRGKRLKFLHILKMARSYDKKEVL